MFRNAWAGVTPARPPSVGPASGAVRSEPTTEPTALVARLSEQFDGEVPELQVRRPTLEDVYLRLLGSDIGTEADISGERELLS